MLLDEEKHDLALNYAAEAHKIPARFEERSSKNPRTPGSNSTDIQSSKQLSSNEAVFFVLLPIFRFLGDTGLRTTSQLTLAGTSKLMSPPTRLSAKTLGLNSDQDPQQS